MHFPPKQWRSIFLGFKITADDDCSHEIKRHVLLGRKTVTNVLRVLANLLRLCLTLCNPMDCNPTDSSARGISQARILGWVAFFFSRGSSRPRNRTQVSCIAGRFFTDWAMRDASHRKLIHSFCTDRRIYCDHIKLAVPSYIQGEAQAVFFFWFWIEK